jgi:hypothetical protein
MAWKRGNLPASASWAHSIYILGEIALERVVAGHLVELATLLVKPHPQAPLLVEEVGHV